MFKKFIPILFLTNVTLSAQAQPSDPRTPIYLNAAQKALVLKEMRGFLEGVDGILQGALAENMTNVEKAARPHGLKALRSTPQDLKQVLPAGFMKMGPKTHQIFQAIADDARDLGDPQQTLDQLKSLTATCIACHRAYRLETR